MVGKARLERGI